MIPEGSTHRFGPFNPFMFNTCTHSMKTHMLQYPKDIINTDKRGDKKNCVLDPCSKVANGVPLRTYCSQRGIEIIQNTP